MGCLGLGGGAGHVHLVHEVEQLPPAHKSLLDNLLQVLYAVHCTLYAVLYMYGTLSAWNS